MVHDMIFQKNQAKMKAERITQYTLWLIRQLRNKLTFFKLLTLTFFCCVNSGAFVVVERGRTDCERPELNDGRSWCVLCRAHSQRRQQTTAAGHNTNDGRQHNETTTTTIFGRGSPAHTFAHGKHKPFGSPPSL